MSVLMTSETLRVLGLTVRLAKNTYRGVDGQRRKQKIGKGQWKPIDDFNQVEPQDGYDVYTTIDVNIQDIAHHALLEQLERYTGLITERWL